MGRESKKAAEDFLGKIGRKTHDQSRQEAAAFRLFYSERV